MKNLNIDLPNDIEAEKAVLGALLIAPNTDMILDELDGIIKPTDFYRQSHQIIYLSMIDLVHKNTSVDMVTLTANLKKYDELDKIGGIAYITDLANYVPSAVNYKDYAYIVKDKAIKRAYIRASEDIKNIVKNSDDTDTMQEEIEKIILSIGQNYNDVTDIPDIEKQIQETVNNIENRYKNHQNGTLSGIDTGYVKLNEATGGLQKSDLIILAARPSMGKSAFALNLAMQIAISRNIPTAIFSLEMSKEQLHERLISAKAVIDSNNLRQGKLDSKEWDRIVDYWEKTSQAPLYIDDSSILNISQLRAKVRKLKREKNIQLVIIDYLQLMEGTRKDNRQQEISEISRQLKVIAGELNIVVIALSQLSRGLESRQDKRPTLSDLRDSGAIEQDADIVAFLYREDYYKPETQNKGLTELIIRKHRNGSTGTIKLFFHKEFCRFEPYLGENEK